MNTTPPAGDVTLPEITAERVDTMERVVLARIADESRTRRTRRRRLWTGGAAAGVVLILAAVIAPNLTSSFSLGGSASSSAEDTSGVVVVPEEGSIIPPESISGASGGSSDADAADSGKDSAPGATEGRDIVANGSAALTVDDAADAAARIVAEAEERGGYVEALQLSENGASSTDGMSEGAISEPYPVPVPPGGGWLTVRVPAGELTGLMSWLGDVGEVTSSSVGRQDVTDQAVDLRARVAASEASVARLTELIAQAGSLSDLIAAESALADRQAELDADRQQLQQLESQVALSSLSVQLSPQPVAVEADPAGFGDGIAAGWNGLVATLNGFVIAFGFLLPWLVVAAVIAALVWSVARLVRRRDQRGDDI